ncbi:hypothetical protein AMIS_41430 [Actinoplanes missouriensis 431]|uniref:Uncharacterized protein n=1 Tax=Actinoplanes missouriensis (strain ATCC 14538 / DSM 43046 / CBS 188.64 / JCM 3121 / NBRC 102363 / NCIMB 12654 / NRRL B-3342 / UNCC 431) TaxID=512565 RepID=I0H8M6_ACTM4|nr:DUF5957 family protein [Actinoplanes missouriensis]BAL89363.1 hypothetical protein AMIS_41430 [Actinoplanes missouriensis 431]
MRTLGALVAGMFAGLVVGVLLAEPVVRLAGPPTADVSVLLGFAPAVLAIAGAAAGVLIERRTR